MQNAPNTPVERSAFRPLRRGDIVEVFDHPLTGEGYEGVAVLLAPYDDADPATGCQDWLVMFLYEDGEFRRTVHPRHRKGKAARS